MPWLLPHAHVHTPRNKANMHLWSPPTLNMNHFHLWWGQSEQNITLVRAKHHLSQSKTPSCYDSVHLDSKSQKVDALYIFKSATSHNVRPWIARMLPLFSFLTVSGRSFRGIMWGVNQIAVTVMTPFVEVKGCDWRGARQSWRRQRSCTVKRICRDTFYYSSFPLLE